MAAKKVIKLMDDKWHSKILISVVLISIILIYNFLTLTSLEHVNIGVVYSDPYVEEEIISILKLAQNDINQYSRSVNSNYIFDFTVVYLPFVEGAIFNITEKLKNDGIDLIVGCDSSAQCKESLSFIKNNKMLLLSPYSSSDTLSIVGDNLFRLRSNDSYQGLVISKMLIELDIKAIIILSLNITWGNEINNKLIREYTKEGGDILSIIKYDYEKINNATTFNSLEIMVQNALLKYDINEIAIVNIGLIEVKDIMKKVESYKYLQEIQWFGSDAIPSKFLSELFQNNLPKSFSKVIYSSPIQAPEYSKLFIQINERYKQECGSDLDFVQSARYDAFWIYALSILHSKTTKSSEIMKVLPLISSNYHGLTGKCLLNQYGDRIGTNYDIFGFFEEFDEVKLRVYGRYNVTSDKFIWYEK